MRTIKVNASEINRVSRRIMMRDILAVGELYEWTLSSGVSTQSPDHGTLVEILENGRYLIFEDVDATLFCLPAKWISGIEKAG